MSNSRSNAPGGRITGAYGAKGTPGGEAISNRLTELAGGIKSSAGKARGFWARIRHVTKGAKTEKEKARRLGISESTWRRWRKGGEKKVPRGSGPRVEKRYQEKRKSQTAQQMKRRLGNNGRGTRVEVHPITQAGVDPSRQRDLGGVRKVNIRPAQWDRLVDQWAAGDVDAMNSEWEDIAEDTLGSEWGAYTSVAAIGFGA